MAKVLVIDDFYAYSEMTSLLIEKKGHHEVRADILPFKVEDIHAFCPDVIVLSLVRKIEALNSRLIDFYTEVDGAKALRELVQNDELKRYPLIITAIGLEERELPPGLPHLAFIDIPHRLDNLVKAIDRVAAAGGKNILPE